MFNHVTADGYFSAPDGNLDWVVPDEEVDQNAVERMPGIDTILLGRRTYELFEAFWPHALDESPTSADPHDSSRRTLTLRAIALWINEANKLVFSRSLKKVTWKNARIVHEVDPGVMEAMKRESGKDMIVFGSGSIVSALTKHALIDEYQFVVNPILLGAGGQLVRGVSNIKLNLIEARQYSSGNVLLRYSAA
jgi:dihydrofolate reductase